MQDVYMLLLLGAAYGLFRLFISWCVRVIQESEGDRP